MEVNNYTNDSVVACIFFLRKDGSKGVLGKLVAHPS